MFIDECWVVPGVLRFPESSKVLLPYPTVKTLSEGVWVVTESRLYPRQPSHEGKHIFVCFKSSFVESRKNGIHDKFASRFGILSLSEGFDGDE